MSKLESISIPAPAVQGLNTQGARGITDASWALTGTNCVFDDNDRVAARKGWSKVTSSGVTTHDLEVIYVFEEDENTSHVIVAGQDSNDSDNHTLWTGTTTLTDKTGTLTPAGSNWQFATLQGKVFGAQDGETLIYWDGEVGTNFADVAGGGTPPDGDCVLALGGRIWGINAARDTLLWSNLLDGTTWNGADAGSVKIGTHLSEDDFIVGLAAFQKNLIVFCRQSIVIFDGVDDPVNNLVIAERIPGVGCIARDSVQSIGSDIVFLDESGLRSLSRSLTLEATPMVEMSINNRDLLLNDVEGATKTKINAVYNSLQGFYLLNVPSSNEHVHWYMDVRKANKDGSPRMFRWNHMEGNAFAYDRRNDTFWIAKEGIVGKYDTYQDNATNYIMEVLSGWMQTKNADVLVPKRCKFLVVGGAGYNVTVAWKFNFSDEEQTSSFDIPTRPVTEWNGATAEYNISEWTGTDTSVYRPAPIEMGGAGHRLSVGWRLSITGNAFAVQTIDVFVAVGRTAIGADDF